MAAENRRAFVIRAEHVGSQISVADANSKLIDVTARAKSGGGTIVTDKDYEIGSLEACPFLRDAALPKHLTKGKSRAKANRAAAEPSPADTPVDDGIGSGEEA